MRREALISLILVVSILSVYWQVKDHEFINYDDNVYITDNPQVQLGFTSKTLRWAFTTTQAGNWHPLTWLSHMLDCRLFGLNPAGHHLTNVFLHIMNSILLFLALRWATSAIWPSALVASLFAIHPLHVESVAWVAERKDVLSTFFLFLTILAYINYVKRPRKSSYLLVLFLFTLGLTAKPMLVTLPFVLLLLDYWPLNRCQLRREYVLTENETGGSLEPIGKKLSPLKLIGEKLPMFMLSGISCVITLWAQERAGAMSGLDIVPLKWRIANALVACVSYIAKMIWPQNLSVFYPHPENSLPIWQAVLAGLFLIIASIIFIRLAPRYKYGVVGWLWYLGTLVPVIGLVQVGEQAMADRYTYVPLIGLFIIIAWGLADFVNGSRRRRNLLTISFISLLVLLALCSWKQARLWRNSVRIFQHALKVTTDNYVAHYTLGNALALQGNLVGAMMHYNEALRIKPNHAEVHNNLGNALALQGNLAEAVSHYKESLRISPRQGNTHRNLGVALDRQGKYEEAMHHYLEALRLNPQDAQSHNNIGVTLAEQGKLEEAIKHFSEALRINPNFTEAQRNLENGLRLVGKETRKNPGVGGQ
ncbi:MAG: tetratricopeptide repeat protein [Deltaproteobacteria bacterium]|nr:tetratricopeptide repeat protein [Deltaproteobacteria bacterium]